MLIPIFFMPGVIGLLFHEFAVVVMAVHPGIGRRLADARAHDGSRLLWHHEAHEERLRPARSSGFQALLDGYARTLDVALQHRVGRARRGAGQPGAARSGSGAIPPKGFFPEEDIGQLSASTEAAGTRPSTP